MADMADMAEADMAEADIAAEAGLWHLGNMSYGVTAAIGFCSWWG